MTVHHVIPYVYGGNEHRAAAFKLVREYYRENYIAGSTICYNPPGRGKPFNKAREVNQCVAAARPERGDIIVLNDADSLVPFEQLQEAIRLARFEPGLVVAYTDYWRLDRASSEACTDVATVLRADEWADFEEFFHGAGSPGVCALSYRLFSAVGGLDESYVGWGYEDLDFVNRCGAIIPTRRVAGPLYHLWHDERRDDDSPASTPAGLVAANLARYTQSL